MRPLLRIAVCALAGAAAGPDALAGEGGVETVDLEGVSAWQRRNAVQSPNDPSGTRFALDALTGEGPAHAPRIQVAGRASGRHEWRVLYAPLSVTGEGASAVPIRFEGETFDPGRISARYRFDSWRATWRWRWIERDDLVVKVGVTAKIRDASIRLRQGGKTASKTDTGFVPLLHGAFERRLSPTWSLQGDIDALAGGPGYAVDAGLRVAHRLSDEWRVTGGLRWLDGGADSDEVYAFASFVSVTVGVSWTPR